MRNGNMATDVCVSNFCQAD